MYFYVLSNVNFIIKIYRLKEIFPDLNILDKDLKQRRNERITKIKINLLCKIIF
jgi:hypothetical protein